MQNYITEHKSRTQTTYLLSQRQKSRTGIILYRQYKKNYITYIHNYTPYYDIYS